MEQAGAGSGPKRDRALSAAPERAAGPGSGTALFSDFRIFARPRMADHPRAGTMAEWGRATAGGRAENGPADSCEWASISFRGNAARRRLFVARPRMPLQGTIPRGTGP